MVPSLPYPSPPALPTHMHVTGTLFPSPHLEHVDGGPPRAARRALPPAASARRPARPRVHPLHGAVPLARHAQAVEGGGRVAALVRQVVQREHAAGVAEHAVAPGGGKR